MLKLFTIIAYIIFNRNIKYGEQNFFCIWIYLIKSVIES